MIYLASVFVFLCVYSILALSLNVVTGYTGRVNLAHGAFFGIGAYTAALAMLHGDVGFLPAAGLAMVVAALLSLALSLPSLRFAGSLFVIVSLAVQSLTYAVLYNWTSVTNGPYGLSGISRPSLFGTPADTSGMALIAGLATLACIFLVHRMLHSPWGRLLQAIRDDELAARSLGKKVWLAKVEAIAVASGMAGVAGALYASYAGFIDPTSFSLDVSIMLLSMVLIGGTGNVRGPLVGALAVVGIREVLRFSEFGGSIDPHLRAMAYGILLIFIAHKRPQGLAGRYRFQ